MRLPTNGSLRILNASAENGSSSRAVRVMASPFSRQALGGRHLDGRRHELDDGIEQRLHALVLERRAAHAQHDLVLERARLEAALDLVVRQRARHSRYLSVSASSPSAAASIIIARYSSASRLERGRDLAELELHALGFHVPVDGLHLDEVDDPFEGVFGADGQLDGHGIGAQARADHVAPRAGNPRRRDPSC